jgi:hypothetical protein
LPLTANDKDLSSKQVLVALGNNAVAEVVAFVGIVAASEHGDQHVVVQHKAYDLDEPAEAGIEVVAAMELGPGAAVLVLDDIHSALHSACPHSVADSHLVVAFEGEVFASLLAFLKLASPSSAFVGLCRWEGEI